MLDCERLYRKSCGFNLHTKFAFTVTSRVKTIPHSPVHLPQYPPLLAGSLGYCIHSGLLGEPENMGTREWKYKIVGNTVDNRNRYKIIEHHPENDCPDLPFGDDEQN